MSEQPAHEEATSEQLRRLTAEVAALRAEVRRIGPATLPQEGAGWDDPPAPAASHAWVSSVAPPVRPPLRIPRLPFELAFLAGVAVLAGVADLRPIEIAAVMALAWVVVALAEFAGSRGDRQRLQLFLAEPVVTPPRTAQPAVDPAWFAPPVEHTLLAGSPDDHVTAVGALPPRPEGEDGAGGDHGAASDPPANGSQGDDESTGVTQLPPHDDDPETTAEHRAGG